MKKLFVVYDTKSETYTPPQAYNALGEALRSFTDAANDKNSMVGLHPEDFSLFEVGSYDIQTAKFELLATKKHIADALDLITERPEISEKPQAVA